MLTTDLYQEATQYAQVARELAIAQGIVRYRPDGTIGHLPFSLLPWRASVRFWQQGLDATLLYNKLYHRVTLAPEFLEEHLNQARQVDPFVSGLFDCWNRAPKPIFFMSRSDFMPSPQGPKQVEMNLMAASLGNASEKVYGLLKFLYSESLAPQMPLNNAGSGLAKSLAEVFHRYRKPRGIILFIVPPGEVNAFDQRTLQYMLVHDHGAAVQLTTLEEIADEARLERGELHFRGRPVVVAYFRAGYSPTHYENPKTWEARKRIESSDAISVPAIGTQLANTKKIQQVLASREHLEKFLTRDEATQILNVQVKMTPVSQESKEAALKNPADWVMKPFREGGGNNFFHQEMVDKLNTMSAQESEAFILMEAIRQPSFRGIRMVNDQVVDGSCVTELGHFTTCLYEPGKNDPEFNRTHGYLLRTKNEENTEGLVLGGYSYLDAVALTEMSPSHGLEE